MEPTDPADPAALSAPPPQPLGLGVSSRGQALQASDKDGAETTGTVFAPSGFLKVDADYTPKPYEEWKAKHQRRGAGALPACPGMGRGNEEHDDRGRHPRRPHPQPPA